MNIYKVKRILFISLMITILVSSSMQIVYAATASELQQQQNELDKQIEKTASEIAGVKEQMTEQLTKINQLNIKFITIFVFFIDMPLLIKRAKNSTDMIFFQ